MASSVGGCHMEERRVCFLARIEHPPCVYFLQPSFLARRERKRERDRETEREKERSSGYPTNIASGWLSVWFSSPYCLLERERERKRKRERESIHMAGALNPRQKAGLEKVLYTHGISSPRGSFPGTTPQPLWLLASVAWQATWMVAVTMMVG